MAVRTPQLTSPTHRAPAIEAGPARSATTTSRAVRPGVAVEHTRLPEKEFGESLLVWRCLDCGALGSLTEFPDACPACALPREYLRYEVED